MLLRVLGSKRSINTYALLDEGSTITLIDEKLTRELNARGSTINIALKGINGKEVIMYNSEEVNLNVEGSFGQFEIKGAVTLKNLQLPSQTITHEFIFNLQNLDESLNIQPYYNAEVKLLIGQDNLKFIATRELREVENSNIAISRSLLVWSVHGSFPRGSRSQVTSHEVLKIEETPITRVVGTHRGDESCDEETRLDDLVKHYFELESICDAAISYIFHPLPLSSVSLHS